MLVDIMSAFRGLASNKLRSFLTTLGVIFGVGAVIVAVALGQGSRDASMKRFQRLGTTTLSVIPGRSSRSGVSFGSVSTLKLEDAAYILRNCPAVRRVSPEKSGRLQAKAGSRNADPTIYGTGADFPIIRKFEFTEGQYFTNTDVQGKRMVCILGHTAYKDLFDSGSVIGKRVYLKGLNFKVIGRFKERGGGGFFNEDDRIYVPVTTALRRLFGTDLVLSSMSVQGRSEALMQKAQDEVDAALRKKHKIGTGKPGDVIIFNAGTAAQTSSEQAADFEQLINCLAAVALMVGGIGIMNIMLVSVTERTREIGIRKAIGAKRFNILTQFMMEALLLSLSGGLIGVIFGIIFTLYGLPRLKPDWETTLSMQPVLISFGFSALVGVVFGFYPAMKASKLNPIDALRYE